MLSYLLLEVFCFVIFFGLAFLFVFLPIDFALAIVVKNDSNYTYIFYFAIKLYFAVFFTCDSSFAI